MQRDVAGGGVALTNGIHMLDRIAYVCGQPLTLVGGSAGYTQQLGDVEDTAAMQLRLADGTPAHLLASWVRGGQGTDDELTIYGTGGTLRVWAWRGWRFEPIDGCAEERACYDPKDNTFVRGRIGMAGAIREFVSAVTDERDTDPLPEEALAAQAIIDEFYRGI